MDTRVKNPSGNIPTIPSNKAHVNSALGMMACLQELKQAEQMKKRFKAIPNGWRDLRMIEAVLSRLIDDILQTYPLEKLVSMQRMLPHMKYRLQCGATASKLNEDECIILEKDLDTLSIYAHEQCKLCFNQDCKRCPLGKVLDGIIAEDRDGRSWANIDLEAMTDANDHSSRQ